VGAAWRIALKDLSLRLRDRSVFIIGFIAPLALAFVFNGVFGQGISDVGRQITFDMGVVDLDDGSISTAFRGVLAGLEGEGLITLADYRSEADVRQSVDAGDVGAVFVLPAGMSTAYLGGGDVSIDVIGNVDNPTTTEIADAIANRFAIGVRTSGLAAATAAAVGVISPSDLGVAAQQAATVPPVVGVGDITAATRQLDSATYFVAGLSVFFVFFIAGLGVTSMLEERQDGTLARLLAAPIPRASIVAGKAIASVVIGLASLTVLIVASRILMGAEWGDPVAVALLVTGAVLTAVALMSLVGGMAKTAEQAGNLQAIVATSLAMLGGTFVPISQGDGFLGKLTLITPNAWFLRGLGDLAGGGLTAALPAAAVLWGMGLVLGAGALAMVQRTVRP